MRKLVDFSNQTSEHYQAFAFNRVIQEINNFTNTTLSAFYFDIIKDSLYADSIQSSRRKGVLEVLANVSRTVRLTNDD